MIVLAIWWSFVQAHIKMDNERRIQMPQMKASLDKNKSQRMGRISCKIALFCQPEVK